MDDKVSVPDWQQQVQPQHYPHPNWQRNGNSPSWVSPPTYYELEFIYYGSLFIKINVK